MAAAVVEQDQFVFVAADSLLREVAHQQRQILHATFLLGMLREILALGGKAHAERRIRQARDMCQDIRVGRQFQRERRRAFLDLLFARMRDAVIRHRRHTDKNIAITDVPLHRLEHLRGAHHIHSLRATRLGERRRAGHQHHFRALLQRGLRDGIAHLAGTAVGNAAHRIDRLIGRPGSDQDFLAGKKFRLEECRMTLPTRSAPTSAPLVKMPPPRRAKIEISDEPNARPSSGLSVAASGVAVPPTNQKNALTPSSPRPTTSMPVIAPPLKAMFSAGPIPFVAACAVRTLARTETFMPMKPHAPDSTAPRTNPGAVTLSRNTAIRSASTTPTIAIVRYCRARYAAAPCCTAPEISCIRALPASCDRIHLRWTKP